MRYTEAFEDVIYSSYHDVDILRVCIRRSIDIYTSLFDLKSMSMYPKNAYVFNTCITYAMLVYISEDEIICIILSGSPARCSGKFPKHFNQTRYACLC